MKHIALLFLFVVLFTGVPVYAHTGVENSSPEEGAVVTEEVQSITINFDTEIEQTSSFELRDSTGESIQIDELSIEGNTMKGTLEEPLGNEEYQVQWNIIGADAHAIEGAYSFTVDREETEVPADTEEDEGASESVDQDSAAEGSEDKGGEGNSGEETESSGTGDQENSSNTGIVVTLVAVLVVLLGGSVWWMFRRKR